MSQPQQSTPFLQGDLASAKSDLIDLRNDNAGSKEDQARSIVLRYLESLPAEGQVDLDSMVQDITRRYPFHGEKVEFFRDIVASLEKEGWLKSEKGSLRLDKVARVMRRYLFGSRGWR